MANLCEKCQNAPKGKMKYTDLMRAASKGHNECVTSLIEAGADVNAVDEGNPLESHSFCHFGRCDNALMEAAKGPHPKCVEILIKSGADVNLRGKDNDSPLIRAALNGDEKSVDLLIRAGANVDIVNMYDYSALISAARNGHDKCVELLLQGGADVNISPDSNYSALTEASINGHAHCLALLVEKGTDHATISKNFGSRALIGAAEGGHHKCVKLLLSADVNNNKTYDKGHFDALNRSLVRAAFGGHTECVKLLLDAGADVNFHNRSFETSSQTCNDNVRASSTLEAAAAIGANDVFTESLSVLQSSISKLEQWINDMSNGAQNSGQGENLVSDVSQSLEQFKLPEMDIDPAAIGGNTALIGAAGSGSVECAKILLEAGADVNASNCKGKTALMIAAAFHSLQCIQLFLRRGVHVNMVDSNGQNALKFHIMENGTKSNRCICMLLFTAGETINRSTIERTDEYDGRVTSVGVPRYLLRLQETNLSLKDICRQAVREYLLQLDAVNLFCKVPKLEPHIPSILIEYLLYDTSLDESSESFTTSNDGDNDDNDQNNNDDGDEDFDDDDSDDDDDDSLNNEDNPFMNDGYDDAIFRTYPPLGIPYLPRNGLKMTPLPPPLPLPSLAHMEVKVNEMANGLVNCVKEDENRNDNDDPSK